MFCRSGHSPGPTVAAIAVASADKLLRLHTVHTGLSCPFRKTKFVCPDQIRLPISYNRVRHCSSPHPATVSVTQLPTRLSSWHNARHFLPGTPSGHPVQTANPIWFELSFHLTRAKPIWSGSPHHSGFI